MKKTEYGFTDIYGVEWTDKEVDLYNKVSEEIDNKERDNYFVAEWMYDARHRQYNAPFLTTSLYKGDN